MSELPVINEAVFGFDARGVAKRFRHAAIFGALESLDDGETMRFVNDHDPLPLLNQIQQRYGNQVGIKYVAREPGNIVIDFSIQLGAQEQAPAQYGAQEGSCGGGGGGCGCSGGR
ncbi:DUF2249 domain-containing protein [Thauera sinica]|uniref:DUF2249 domain-containing protein n=1 Tax=Thauera sinica TaxID=2665146 RepID=A0ABW1AQF6_9RHOO|nr:DUF2249 domain-containing protein [Thauera sp. K11]ATE59648.1 hypothetical protein CCZ27_06525 [Thauera sp. K11]